jgi:N-acetylmuramoyl-L-alanine amidase
MDFRGQACLVELGFIDNPGDRALLTSRDTRLKFANGLLALWRTTIR